MPVQTVSQLTRYLRDVLTADPFLADLWVSGEASNCSVSQAGHTILEIGTGTTVGPDRVSA